MPGAVYETVVELTAKGDFSSKLEGMNDAVGKLSSATADMGSKLSDAFTGAVDKAGALAMSLTKLGAATVMGGIVYGVASLNAGLEKTQVSLAAIFNANGAVGSMGEGMKVGADQMAKMRKDAAELPGEFSDLVGIFRAATIPGLRAGLSIDQIRDLSANTMAAGAASGLQMDMVAREMGMLLSGRAGAHNVLGSQIFGLSGDAAKKFNASSGEDRVKVLNKQLEKFGEAKAQFGKTWEGVTSTLVDNGKSIIGAATLPLFNAIKSSLGEVNNWFDANQDQIKAYTSIIAGKLQDAFYAGKAVFLEYLPILRNFASEAWNRIVGVWQSLLPIVKSVGAVIDKMLRDPSGTLDKFATVLTLYAGLKVAGPLASGVSSLAGGAGVAAAGATGIGAIAGGLAIADILAVSNVLTDTTSDMNTTATVHWASMKASGEEAFSKLGAAWEKLSGTGTKLADIYGVWVITQLDRAASALLVYANYVSWMTDLYISLGRKIEGAYSGWMKRFGLDGSNDPKLNPTGDPGVDRSYNYDPSLKSLIPVGDAIGKGVAKATKEAPKGHGVHVDKVEITIAGQSDPSRVARIVASHLTELARNPKASRFTPQYSGAK